MPMLAPDLTALRVLKLSYYLGIIFRNETTFKIMALKSCVVSSNARSTIPLHALMKLLLEG